MTDKEFLVHTIKDEAPRFERVFKEVEKVPKSKHSYKHDKKSRTTMELLKHTFGSESGMFVAMLKGQKLDFMTWPKPKWKTVEAVRKEFMKNIKLSEKLISKISEKNWSKKATIYVGGKPDWQDRLGTIMWALFLDLIHHRGQLSTHLRPMGGKVPSIYGPSADTSM